MKSERRHELQHNQLADAIGLWTERAAPYSRAIAGALVLLLVVGFGMAYLSGKRQAKSEAAWDEYFEALNNRDRAKLSELAEKYAGSPVAPLARVVAADMQLGDGCMMLFNQKAEGRDLLQQAVDNYQTALSEADEHELKQRALFGLARGHEALGALTDVKKARDDYKRLIDEYPESVYTPAAKQRLADLERGSTKQFYDWFVKYEPPRAAAGVGKKPSFIEDALDKNDLKTPSVTDQFDSKDKSKDDSILGTGLLKSPADEPEVPATDVKPESPADAIPEAPQDAAPEAAPPESPPADAPAEPAPEESK